MMDHNHIRPWRNIARRKSRQIMDRGRFPVGGDAPISVRTMTNTDSGDAPATIKQVLACVEAAADYCARLRCRIPIASRALREVVRESPVPIVADIHFHYKRAYRGG